MLMCTQEVEDVHTGKAHRKSQQCVHKHTQKVDHVYTITHTCAIIADAHDD